MASIEGIKRRLNEWKPKVQSAFVVYLTPRESPIDEVDDSFEIIEINTPDHPLLPKVTNSSRQLKLAKKSMANGSWNMIVALLDGEPVGRIWERRGTKRPLFDGVPRMHLADDEFVMFDLYVVREHRRGGLAFTMADYFFKKYAPDVTPVNYVYGFISYENVPSIMWHDSIGFQIAQTMNYLEIGPYIKWKIPFSDMPRFGPMSRKNRTNEPDRELFGPRMMP